MTTPELAKTESPYVVKTVLKGNEVEAVRGPVTHARLYFQCKCGFRYGQLTHFLTHVKEAHATLD